MMKKCRAAAAIAIAFSLVPLSHAGAQSRPFSAAEYIHQAIEILKANALNSGSVDWTAIEREADAREIKAKDAIDTFDTIVWLLMALGDHHSFPQFDQNSLATYQARYGTTPWPASLVEESRLAEEKRISTFSNRSDPSWQVEALRRGKDVVHLVVPTLDNADQKKLDSYTSVLLKGIQTNRAACGYIVDLRGNLGGNEWPMVMGLSPLLGSGIVGGTVSPKEKGWVLLQNGVATLKHPQKTEMLYRFDGSLPRLNRSTAPVALLIDDATASSGEGTAISFEGRPDTRFFGLETSGHSTVNQGFALPDGTNMVVTVGVMADRRGRPYPNGVKPDVVVDPTAAKAGKPDLALGAAKKWLLSTRPCRVAN